MTEKRFYVAESKLIDGYCVFDREKKYAFCPRPRMADCLNDAHILNELAEENEQSKMMIATLRNTVLDQEDLEKENKELKKELGSFKPIIFETENGATTLYEKRDFE